MESKPCYCNRVPCVCMPGKLDLDQNEVSFIDEEYERGRWSFTIHVDGVPVRVGDNVGVEARRVAGLVHTGLSLLKLKLKEEGHG